MNELEALTAQYAELSALIDELKPSDWDMPTRCPPMTVHVLIAHILFGQESYNAYFDTRSEGPATFTRVSWWQYLDKPGYQEIARRAAARIEERAAGLSRGDLVKALREVFERGIELHAETAPDVLLARGDRVISAGDLSAVRVVESGIHTMDAGHATLRGERLAGAAAPVIIDTLNGLAGTPMPVSIGWVPRTYALTATGRRPLSSTERHTLGPLAEKFPLLA